MDCAWSPVFSLLSVLPSLAVGGRHILMCHDDETFDSLSLGSGPSSAPPLRLLPWALALCAVALSQVEGMPTCSVALCCCTRASPRCACVPRVI